MTKFDWTKADRFTADPARVQRSHTGFSVVLAPDPKRAAERAKTRLENRLKKAARRAARYRRSLAAEAGTLAEAEVVLKEMAKERARRHEEAAAQELRREQRRREIGDAWTSLGNEQTALKLEEPITKRRCVLSDEEMKERSRLNSVWRDRMLNHEPSPPHDPNRDRL